MTRVILSDMVVPEVIINDSDQIEDIPLEEIVEDEVMYFGENFVHLIPISSADNSFKKRKTWLKLH